MLKPSMPATTSLPREMRGDNLNRIGVKLFAVEPPAAGIRAFVPVFHTWIQKQSIDEHLLIDVHDYSHIHHGPGILLVAHEGNFSIDMADGRMGLVYYRKQSSDDSVKDRLASVLKSALQASSLLEDEAVFESKLRFRTDELLFFANDRLLAPNDSGTFSKLHPDLTAIFQRLLGDASFSSASYNPKDRFTVRIHGNQRRGIKDLLPLLG